MKGRHRGQEPKSRALAIIFTIYIAIVLLGCWWAIHAYG